MPLLMMPAGAYFEAVVARTALAVQQIKVGAITPTYAAVGAGGHSFPNTGREFLHVKATGDGCTVTIQTPGNVDGLAISDRTVAIEAGEEAFIGPFPASVYNLDASTDVVYVNVSPITDVEIAVLRA